MQGIRLTNPSSTTLPKFSNSLGIANTEHDANALSLSSPFRNPVKRTLFRYLWCGNVRGAISYVRSLPNDAIRNESRRKELIEYLERKEYAIQCYAVRRNLGLTTTSNPVEKANDLTVARRQKKKSMSWSRHGSIGLAALTALYMNNEAERWHESHTLSYEMYEKYGDGMATA